MISLGRARELLASALSMDALLPIAHELGFAGRARELDGETRQALGIPREIESAHIVRGVGSARALTLAIIPGVSPREALTRTASRLSARAPQLTWLLLAVDAPRAHVAIATISYERQTPRTRALICERANVVDSDAETLCALASARDQIDVVMHCRWTEILGREALTRRFYVALERVVNDLARSHGGPLSPGEASELALLYTSRLLFLSFLETQGWLNDDHGFLANGFAECMGKGGSYHRRVLLPLFFGTLNTPTRARSPRAAAFGRIPFLNGGLFSRTSLERRAGRTWFSDEAMGKLYGDLLCRHRFTPREESADWSESAVDPEMLGKAFESLMLPANRKSSGAFYTPHSLVDRMMRAALAHALETRGLPQDHLAAILESQQAPERVRPLLLSRINSICILDPACGTGAFLVFALSELARMAKVCDDPRTPGAITRSLLTTSIFGVDINPTAVWLCELRLWLTMVMEQRFDGIAAVTPLPNLDRQIRVGDTLAGGSFAPEERPATGDLSRLRVRYSRARGPRKKSLAKELDRAERSLAVASLRRELDRALALRRDLLLAARSRDLFGARNAPGIELRNNLAEVRLALRELRQRIRELERGAALPFEFSVHFAEAAASGGFDLVIGNPPWVRLHRIPAGLRKRMREEFVAFRSSAWEAGANGARAGVGFGSQVDMAALFIERSVQLARAGGVVALLVPAKLWTSLAGGGVRELLAGRTRLLSLEDLSDAPIVFDAAVYPSVVIARRDGFPADEHTTVAVHHRATSVRWRARPSALRFDESMGSPWLIAPPDVRKAFDRVRAAGVPLAQTRLGRPLLGVKSGCNEAFIVSLEEELDDSQATVSSNGRAGTIERAVLRPVIKGEHVAAWRTAPGTARIVWTHDSNARALRQLPPSARRWLNHYRGRLEARTDGRSSQRWWSLFRTEGAACDVPRVVWADVAKRPRAAVLDIGDPSVPLNTCYVARCGTRAEAYSLAAILNSDIAAAWLALVAEPARGGYHRYLGWTMALLPMPRDWSRACESLAAIAIAHTNGRGDSQELSDAVLRAYGVSFEEAAPLLAWTA